MSQTFERCAFLYAFRNCRGGVPARMTSLNRAAAACAVGPRVRIFYQRPRTRREPAANISDDLRRAPLLLTAYDSVDSSRDSSPTMACATIATPYPRTPLLLPIPRHPLRIELGRAWRQPDVVRSEPSSTSARHSIRRAAEAFFACVAAARRSAAVMSSRVIATAFPIDAARARRAMGLPRAGVASI